MSSFDLYGINITPASRWGNGVNNFSLWDPDRKAYLDVHQWVAAAPGRTKAQFYKLQQEAINRNAAAVFEKAISVDGGMRALPLDGLLTTAESLNSQAVKQISEASESWQKFYRVINDGASHNVFGLDIETFGDTFRGNDVFGITEIGIAKRVYKDGKGAIQSDFGGAFALGVNNQQRQYLQNLIDRFQRGEWDALDETQQVALRRLSRYAGNFNDVFVERSVNMLNGDSFLMVQKLNRETVNGEAFQSGLNNLVAAHRNQDTNTVLGRITDWIAEQRRNGSLFYGANSSYDTKGIAHTMQYLNNYAGRVVFSEDQIAEIDNLSKNVLDTVYLTRAVATKQGQSVQSLMSSITVGGEPVGATVEEMVQAFNLAQRQTHLSFEDLENEGNVLDTIVDKFFIKKLAPGGKKYIGVKEGVKPLIHDRDFSETAFYIQRGRLQQRDGLDYGIIRSYAADGTPTTEYVKNLSIGKQFWRVDTDLSKVYQDGDDRLYTMVFNNIADEIYAPEGKKDSITRFVISAKDEISFREKLEELVGNSQLYKIDMGDRIAILDPNSPVRADTDIGKMALREQMFKITDNARREYSKLLSPTDVRIDKDTGYYGFQGLKDYLALEDSVREYERTHGPISLTIPERVSTVTKESVDKLGTMLSDQDFAGKPYADKLLKTFYQQQTYLGMRGALNGERPLLNSLIEIVDDTIPAVADGKEAVRNLERTALLSQMYQASLDILYEGRVPYLNTPGVPLRMDYYGVDFGYVKSATGKQAVQRFNAYSPDSLARDISGFLRRNPEISPRDIVKDFKSRGLIDSSFRLNRDIQPYFASQEIASAAYSVLHSTDPDVIKSIETKRLLPTVGEYGVKATQSKRVFHEAVKNFLDPETGLPISVRDLLESSPELQERVLENARGIAGNHSRVSYYNLSKGNNVDELNNLFKMKVMPYLNMDTGSSEDVDRVTRTFGRLLTGPKNYSLSSHANEQVQALFVVPDTSANIAKYQGSSAYMLFFTPQNAGRVIDMVSSGEYDEALKSYSGIMSSDIVKYAAPLELPRFHQYQISDQESIIAFAQGANEKIISRRLATYRIDGGSNQLMLKYEDPASQFLGSLSKVMNRAYKEIENNDTEQAARTMRRAYNAILKDAPSFASYRTDYNPDGLVRAIHFNPNDAIHASEIRLNTGLSEIFNQMAVMHNVGEQDLAPSNFNPVQNILHAFGKAHGINVYDNNYDRYFETILRSDDWREFFQSRSVQGLMTSDAYIGEELRNIVGTANLNYAKPILEIMRDMVNNGKYSEVLGHYFSMDPNKPYSLNHIMSLIPNAGTLTALGSESAVHHGSYFTRPHAAFQSFSGLYSLMRPPYTQQGNSYSFDVKEAIKANSEFSKYTTTKPYNAISFGFNSIEDADVLFRKKIAEAGASLPDGAPRLVVDEHNFIVRAKVMSDIDANLRFDEMGRDGAVRSEGLSRLDALLRDYGFQTTSDEIESLYDNATQQMRSQLGSLYEDKSWASPALKAQPMFQERDAIKLELNPATIDEEATRSQLMKIHRLGEAIESDTVIGFRKDGTHIVYNGAALQFEENTEVATKQIDELLSTGKVKLRPQGYGDIFDDKLLLNGFEKSTLHSVDTKMFAEELGLRDLAARISKTAPDKVAPEYVERLSRDISTMLFSQLSDGAMVVGNYDFAKHGGVVGLHNYWTVLSTRYAEEAARLNRPELLDYFVDVSNDILGKKDFFTVQTVDGMRRVSGSTYQIENPAVFLRKLAEFENNEYYRFSASNENLQRGYSGLRTIVRNLNTQIADELEDLRKHNSFLAIAQRQIMNEHMGKKFTVDQRVEQAFRYSGFHRGPDGLVDVTSSDVDNQLVDLIKQHSKSYTGASQHRFGIADDMVSAYTGSPQRAYEKLQIIQDQFSMIANRDRARYNIENADMKRTMSGMTEALHYYMHPEELGNISKKNIVEVSIDELIDEVRRGGISNPTVEDLKESIFFIDGEPSDFLKKLARRKGDVDLYDGSYSIFIDMGNHKFLANPNSLPGVSGVRSPSKDVNGFLMPILNATHSATQDRYIFQDSQRINAKVLNGIIDTITSGEPSGEQETRLGLIIEEYFKELNANTQYLKKDTDMYKATQTWVIPTSRSLLAQDEVSPYYEDIFKYKLDYVDGKLEKTPFEDGSIFGDNLYTTKRELEAKIRDLGQKGKLAEDSSIDILANYQSVLTRINDNVKAAANQIRDAAGDPAKWQELTALQGISEELARAQREVIESVDENGNVVKKVYNGLAIALSEEAFDTQGIKMADVAKSLISDYQQWQIKAAQHSPVNTKDYFEGFFQFIGEDVDERISLIEGDDKALESMVKRSQFFEDRLQFIRTELQKKGVTIGQDDDIIGGVQAYVAEPLGEKFMRQTPEEFAISIRSLNRDLSSKVYKRMQDVDTIFKQSGLAQSYLQQFGMPGLAARFPVFKGQPWVKYVLDPTLQGNEFRTLNPVLSLMVHLDHDGDTAMSALLGDGTGLLRAREEMARLHKIAYQRNAQDYIPGLLAEAVEEGKIAKVNDPSAWIRQEASLLEIIDEKSFKQGVNDFLEDFKKTNRGKSFARDITAENIKDNPALLEAAMSSRRLSEMFEKTIGSTITNDNAIIAGTVARIRKNYIGYVSTPNYRMRESINQALSMLRVDEIANKDSIDLLLHTMTGFTAMDVGSGGIFSVIEQKVIDPKWAKDSLTPINVSKYSEGLKKLINGAASASVDKRSEILRGAYMNILDSVGAKALSTNGTKDQHGAIAKILAGTSYSQYQDLLQKLNKTSKTGIGTDISSLGLGYSSTKELMPLIKPLTNLESFKSLEQVATTIPQFKSIWEDIVNSGYYSSIVNSNLFKGKTVEELRTLRNAFDELGFSQEVFETMFIRSDDLPPFEVGHVYTRSSTFGGRENVGRFLYRGKGEFDSIDRKGNINKLSPGQTRLRTKDRFYFDQRGFDSAPTIADFRASRQVRDQVRIGMQASQFENTLNTVLLDGNQVRTVLPAKFPTTPPSSVKTFNANKLASIVTRAGQWDTTQASLKQSLNAYSFAVANGQVKAGVMERTGSELLRKLNEDIASQVHRDLAAMGPNPSEDALKALYQNAAADGQGIADLFKQRVIQALPEGEKSYQEINELLKGLPVTWDAEKYNNALQSLQQRIYSLPDELRSLDKIYSNAQQDLDVFTRESAPKEVLDRYTDFINGENDQIRLLRQGIEQANQIQILGGQTALYKMLTPDGFNDDAKKYMRTVFHWSADDTDLSKSIVGFGTYIGQRFENLTRSDVKAILEETQKLQEAVNKQAIATGDTRIQEAFNYASTETVNRLKKFTPTSPKSALSLLQNRQESDILRGVREHYGTLAQNSVNVTATKKAQQAAKGAASAASNTASNIASSNMKRQTINGSILDSLSKNVSGKQVATVVGALAALGVTNKLLHKRKKSPLEPEPSGAGAPPIVNGQGPRQDPERRQSAPPSANTGRPNIYHDQVSGLDFKVSAQTKRRLDHKGYANIAHRSGGGAASVHVYNDTRGVSDNWLSNKFSELAE